MTLSPVESPTSRAVQARGLLGIVIH